LDKISDKSKVYY